MPDATGLLRAIKKAAEDAVEASKPMNICYGTVTSASPLQVNVEQKMTLGDKQLEVVKELTNFSMTVTDSISGTRTMTFNNALQAGDRVILLRQQGGQKYLIIGRASS